MSQRLPPAHGAMDDSLPDFVLRYCSYMDTWLARGQTTIDGAKTVLREFCQYIHAKRMSKSSPSSKADCKAFEIADMNINEICEVDQAEIEEYLSFQQIVMENSCNTLNKKLSCLRRFFSYLEDNQTELEIHLKHGNPVRTTPNQRITISRASPLSLNQVQKLLNGCFGQTAVRDRAIFTILTTSIISLDEICKLNIADIHPDYLLIHPQRGYSRKIQITDACYDAIQSYIAERDDYADDSSYDPQKTPLFVSSTTGKRISQRTIRVRLTLTAEHAGIPGVNLTVLQDTVLSFLLSAVPNNDYLGLLKGLGYKCPEAVAERFGIDLRSHSDPLSEAWKNSAISDIG